MLTAGLRETERHRAPIPELRLVRMLGSPESVFFWVHVDAEGRVLEVQDFKTEGYSRFEYRTDVLVEAVHKISYRPFLRHGVAAEAWVQDEVEVGTESERPLSIGAGKSFPTLVEPTDFSIKFSRSGCYGTCPSYSVVIHGDGKIEFHGEYFVSIRGDHQARIAPEAAARLLERFRAAEFFEFKDKYVASVTDNPTYCLELAIGAKRKTIADYVGTWVGMPTLVSELEDAVDDAAGTDRWVSAGPGTLAAMEEAGIAPNSKEAEEILVHAAEKGKWEAVRTLLIAGAPVASGSLLTVASFIRDPESQHEAFKALLENAEVLANKPGI
jgi:Domain of unknown function (DUF6438)